MSVIAPGNFRHPRGLLDRVGRPGRGLLALIPIIGCWSALVAGWRLGRLPWPIPGTGMDLLFYGVPLGLIVLAIRLPSQHTGQIRAAAAWTALVTGAFILAPKIDNHLTLAIGIPAALACAWLIGRWPEIAVSVVLLMTAFYGSLNLYLGFHYLKLTDLLLVALWLGLIGRLILTRRAERMWIWTGVAAMLAYLAATLVAVWLSPDQQGALSAFQVAPFWMMTSLVIAYSGWSTKTHERIVGALLLVALATGAYACFRYVVGPSHREFVAASGSSFNFVNGHMKLVGSFPTGVDLGSWATMMLPFCFACAIGLRGRVRILAAAAVPLLAISLFGSQLRAGVVAALLAVLVTLILYQVARAYPAGVRIGVSSLAAISAIVVGAGAFTIVSSRGGDLGSRYLSVITLNGNGDVSVSQHQYKWDTALRDLSGHPFGYGFGTQAIGAHRPKVGGGELTPVNTLSVDNGYLKIALEQGMAITVLFGVSLVLVFGGLAVRAVATTDRRKATIAIGAAGSLVTVIVLEAAGAFVEGFPVLATWVAVGLGVAQFQGQSRRRPAAR